MISWCSYYVNTFHGSFCLHLTHSKDCILFLYIILSLLVCHCIDNVCCNVRLCIGCIFIRLCYTGNVAYIRSSFPVLSLHSGMWCFKVILMHFVRGLPRVNEFSVFSCIVWCKMKVFLCFLANKKHCIFVWKKELKWWWVVLSRMQLYSVSG